MTTLPATAPPALPAAIAGRLEAHAHAARGAYADETARAVRRASLAFTTWATGAGLDPLPATPATVAAYVDHLAAEDRSPATIRQGAWAISFIHRAAGITDPTKDELVRLALKRMAKAKGTRQRQAAPLVDDDMRLAIRAAGSAPSRAVVRDLALAMVARDLLGRRSEVVALDVADIAFAKDGSATAIIRKSKTDQTGAGEVRWLAPRTVTWLRRWLESANVIDGALFRSVNKAGSPGGRLPAGDVPRVLRRVADLAGINPTGVSGHSARVGMAQDLAASGAELPAIMQAGRWRSPTMPARYSERMAAGRGAVARFYAGRRD